MKAKWKIFGMIFCLAALLVMPQLALADVTESLIVNGVDILAAADNTVQCGEGTAKYDPATKTLTLNNATINKGDLLLDRLIEAKGIDLKIVLVGENRLDGSSARSSAGICVLAGNLNISGQTGSKLDINVGDSNGISVRKSNTDESSSEQYNLYIDGAVVNIASTGNAVYVEGTVEIKNGAYVFADANSDSTGIYGQTGVVIDNANVHVVSAKANAIGSDKIVTIRNNADVIADGYQPGITGFEGVIIDGAKVYAMSVQSNGVFSPANVEIKNDANVIAEGDYPGIYGGTGVVISGATVDVESDGDVGIFSPVKVEIKANANVTAHGDLDGIRSNGSLVISGSKVNAVSAKQAGIYSMRDISITNNSTITAEGFGAGIEVYGDSLHISGSTVDAKSTADNESDGDNGILCNGGDIIIDGGAAIKAQGFYSGIYSSGKLSISGGKVEAVSSDDSALCSIGNLEIKGNADVSAIGLAVGISSNNGDVLISGSKVNAVSTQEPNENDFKGTGIFASGKVDITSSEVTAEAAFGYGILAKRTDVKNKSDVVVRGTEIGMSCLENVQIKDSKVQVTGEKSIAITGDNPQKGDLYAYGSWLETSDTLDEALTAVNSALIENGEGTVVGKLTLPVNVNIAAGQTLTVPKSAALTVPNGVSLAVNDGGKLVIEEGGKVVKQPGATVVGNENVEGVITEGSSGGSGGGGGGGAAVQSYTLTFETNGGSSIKAVSKTADETVKLADYKPTKEGFEFNGWYADKDLKNKITEIKLDGNKTVYAAWREAGAGNSSPFADIKNDQWFYDDVMFVYEKGLMNGASDNKFDPSGTATRGMLATILWRQAGSPAAEGKNFYNDVPAGIYYTDAICWTTEKGVYTGFGGGVFRPDEQITREQLAAVLYRYAKFQGADVSKTGDIAGFADAGKVSAWAQEPLKWAVGNGIVNGQGNNTLNPQGMAQRADIAAMLHRFLDKFSK